MCQKVRFKVKTNAQRFGTWLTSHVQDEDGIWWFGDKRFDMESGHVALNEVSVSHTPQSGFDSVGHIAIWGDFVERIQEQEVIPGEVFHFESESNSKKVIDFKLVDLAVESLEVTAQCHEPAVLEYFDEVLKQIIRRWPEAGEPEEMRTYFQERGIDQSSLPKSSAEAPLHVRLHKILEDRFSVEDLRTLCYGLEIDYDGLPGEGKSGKARELVQYCQRRNALLCLKNAIVNSRRDISLE